MRFYLLFFSILFLKIPTHATGEPKVLMLIITSDDLPVYQGLQQIWRSYMHSDPEHIDAYFIRANPHLSQDYWIEGDTIWAKATEGLIPKSSGIIDKTILSMEAMLPQIKNYDYVIRTNLSSFYIFPRLLQFLKTLPKTNCYCACPIHPKSFVGSGSGFILSTDLVELLVRKKTKFIGNKSKQDDLLIGFFLNGRRIPLISHPRFDILSLPDFLEKGTMIPEDIFQIRVKTPNENRLIDDIYIQSTLLNTFYEL